MSRRWVIAQAGSLTAGSYQPTTVSGTYGSCTRNPAASATLRIFGFQSVSRLACATKNSEASERMGARRCGPATAGVGGAIVSAPAEVLKRSEERRVGKGG